MFIPFINYYSITSFSDEKKGLIKFNLKNARCMLDPKFHTGTVRDHKLLIPKNIIIARLLINTVDLKECFVVKTK